MITAFYWLPALLEADAIKLSLISEQLSHIDVNGICVPWPRYWHCRIPPIPHNRIKQFRSAWVGRN